MNAARRKAIALLISRIGEVAPMLDELKTTAEEIRDEEQEAYDSLPESFQEGERGERAQEAIDALDEAIGILEGLDVEEINEALGRAAA